jgi:hypothetical protein
MMWLSKVLSMQVVKRVTKHRLGKHPCQTAVQHLQCASACGLAEKHRPSLAELLNTIDLERRAEPVLEENADVHHLREQTVRIRDEYDRDGVLLVGKGWRASDEQV